MIGRLVHFEGTTEAIAILEKGLIDEWADAIRALQGLHHLQVMVDRSGGKAAVLAVWEDMELADGAMEAMIPIRLKILEQGITQSMHDYEVIA